MNTVLDYKIIMVLFQPLTGGNHVANLISTSSKVANRTQHPDYLAYMLEQYSKGNKTFHVTEITNCGVQDIAKTVEIVADSTTPYILAGHIDEAYYIKQKLQPLGSIKYIRLHDFILPEIVKQKLDTPGLMSWLYSDEIVDKLFDTTDTIDISLTNLFSNDITPVVNKLNNMLQLDLNLTFCQQLHNLWLPTALERMQTQKIKTRRL
jgi:hypothetical protein